MENRNDFFRIRGSEYVKVIAKAMALSKGNPAGVEVGLLVNPVTFSATDFVFQKVIGAFLTFSCIGTLSRAIFCNRQLFQVNHSQFI